jgi:hypothetical protein
LHLGRKPDVEEQLYMYLVRRTEQGELVCNKDLKEHATELNKIIYNQDWKPSNGWLRKFKARYCIDTKSVNDDSYELDVDEETTFEEDIEIDEESSPGDPLKEEEPMCSSPVPVESDNLSKSKNVASVSVLNACDILLDFMNEFDFPLKEIITLKVVKDKISRMPESQTTYEVHQETQHSDEYE